MVHFDFCGYGMIADGPLGNLPVKKRTTIMTNSIRIAQRLRKAQCTNGHEHTQLINFNAKQCEVYPGKFCKDVCSGIKEEINDKPTKRANIDTFILNMKNEQLNEQEESLHDDTADYTCLYEGKEFYDDITGEYLDKKRATAALKF